MTESTYTLKMRPTSHRSTRRVPHPRRIAHKEKNFSTSPFEADHTPRDLLIPNNQTSVRNMSSWNMIPEIMITC